MPTKRFSVEAGQPKRLQVSWKWPWRQLAVTLDSLPVGHFESKAELQAGKDFTLPDNSTLNVQLADGFSPELRLTRNGIPVPGSAADPRTRIRQAYWVMFFLGGLLGLIGGASVGLGVQSTYGLRILMCAALYAVLGFFISRHSPAALIAAIVLLSGETLYAVVLSIVQTGDPRITTITVRALLIWPMVRAIPAMREVNARHPIVTGGTV